jgi:3'-phosphoadenosine 5'-phosphosulfate sulfotransferase (PAPS reductase)/FAD synthetase
MSKSRDKNGIWWHENNAGEKKKLLLNPATNQPYKNKEIITNYPRLNGRIFQAYRYDRVNVSMPDYWPIRVRPVSKLEKEFDTSFRIPTPACISFSGGRTSAFMVKKILDAYGGKLPDDILICFANTGKELPETLDFVHKCEKEWNVKVNWLELDIGTTRPIWRTKVVDYKTASRNGEPFEKLLNKNNMLPSIQRRLCTQSLKVEVINRFMRSQGHDEWYAALGLRYDEPRRVSDARRSGDRNINIAPLYEQKITNEDVLNFWENNYFDLNIPSINGKTVAGNCDLCFLKGTNTIVNLLAEKPELADWWIKIEKEKQKKFRIDRPDYIGLLDLSKKPHKPLLEDATYTCFCHD